MSPYLLVLGLTAGLGGKLQEGHEESQAQPQGQEQEEAPQEVGLEGMWGLAPLWQAAAGPPLTLQEGQLPRLTQLQYGHRYVLHHRGAWQGMRGKEEEGDGGKASEKGELIFVL